MKKYLVFSAILFLLSSTAFAQNDKQEIERAILNYVEAFYEADTMKAYLSIAPDLAKKGYYTHNGQVIEAKMNFEQFIRLSQRWKQTQNITPDSPKKITVFDVLDKIASAKVEAKWGIDYFHLAKVNGKWIIMNVLWQEYPKAN